MHGRKKIKMGMNVWNQNAAHSKNLRGSNEHSSDKDYIPATRTTSMSSLILWNISKALQLNPKMDLKAAIKKAQERLDNESRDLNAVLAQEPEQQHIVCALLAWQQLGKSGADSLYKFVEAKRGESRKCGGGCRPPKSRTSSPKKCQPPTKCGSFGSHTSGPIVRLPADTKVVMRMEQVQPIGCGKQCRTKGDCDTMRKIEAACCMDSACVEQLATLDATIVELRTRAAQLARREAERVELLERAEAAWKDLELGYERRLTAAQEKEDDITKQIENIVSERNNYKKVCTDSTKMLNDRGDAVNRLKLTLNDVEKQIIDRACIKMKLNEECTKGETLLAEQQCKISQFERDIKFKEEQARRKLATAINDVDSARALTYETDRAMRAELSGLRQQITQISNELLEEDKGNEKLKKELEEMRAQKAEIVEDLEGCKQMCDSNMQAQIDKLKEKKEGLQAAKDRFLECKCKMPIDETVEVKRTPSLAALCRCAPEDRLLESAECSCTSLRSRLLSNLLADLFGGLQTELSGSGAHMPCHLLKCLEDKHNWDRASVVKTNLRNFFSKLLVGELDIAIATAIENYHATWVGTSCADAPKIQPDPDDDLSEGWQQRALEKKAKKMATEIAENLFQERAVELAERAKALAKSTGPPPCQCKPIPSAPQPTSQTAVFPLLLKPNAPFSGANSNKAASRQSGKQSDGHKQHNGQPNGQSGGQAGRQSGGQPGGQFNGCAGGQPAGKSFGQSDEELYEPPEYWKRTIQDVTQLKMQIEDLKKEAIKKEDLKQILDDKLAKIVKENSGIENDHSITASKDTSNTSGETSKKQTKSLKASKKDDTPHVLSHNKSGVTKRKPTDSNVLLKRTPITDSYKKYNKRATHGQSYAVNVCLCTPQKKPNCLKSGKPSWKQKLSRDALPKTSSFKQTKPIHPPTPNTDADDKDNQQSTHPPCSSNYQCFHKKPSTKSIDNLLGTLVKWKYDLADPFGKDAKSLNISLSKCSKVGKGMLLIDSLNNSKMNLSHSTASHKNQANESDIMKTTQKAATDNDSKPKKQPGITESVYLGAVNLDKSNDDFCKCIKNVKSPKKSHRKNENKNMTYQCIKNNRSNACNCKIYQDMSKDNKISQTEESKKVEIANQFECIHTNDAKERIALKNIAQSKSNFKLHQQSGLDSDPINPSQETGLLSSNCDYYIKFLGVTLADLDSTKNTDKLRNRHAEDIVSRDTNSDRRKRPQKRLPSIESANIFRQPIMKSVITCNQLNSIEKTDKCVCHAQFDELKSFMTDVFSKQLINRDINQNDNGADMVKLKGDKKDRESCVCCNACKVDNSKELELNAFHLLEDHLKKKLEEFKSFSCKSSCIPPEEEEKLFSAILKRVKQVISDCANEMYCGCSNSLTKDSSWNRAYGLLQEYLKIKIKRVQCSCKSSDKKDIALPDILEKVCNLIEHDFQRLKEICKCKNSTSKKNSPIENVDEVSAKDVPERDTNICKNESLLCAVVKLSKQNSNKSMIRTDNTSSQVPPNLGMDSKSCEVVGDKNAQTTETDAISTDNKCNGISYNTCGSCDANLNATSDLTTKFGATEVMVNHYTVNETNKICELQNKSNDIGMSYESDDDNLQIHEQTDSKQACELPCIGYAVECSCDNALGPCVGIKSNNDRINSIWNGVLDNYKNSKQDFSYIMQRVQNKDNEAIKNCQPIPRVLLTDIPEVPHSNAVTCSKGVSISSHGNEVVLKDSTNIENGSVATSYTNSETSPLDWFECHISDERASPIKLSHIYLTNPVDEYKKACSDTGTTATTRLFQTCECERVPLCHVKMLVENIEQNLAQSKCTCDSLMARVCPVHSKIYR